MFPNCTEGSKFCILPLKSQTGENFDLFEEQTKNVHP